jgi:hypothetical protein
MGRTIRSFRLASIQEQKEWKEFRKALDKKDRKIFDDMFSMSDILNNNNLNYSYEGQCHYHSQHCLEQALENRTIVIGKKYNLVKHLL